MQRSRHTRYCINIIKYLHIHTHSLSIYIDISVCVCVITYNDLSLSLSLGVAVHLAMSDRFVPGESNSRRGSKASFEGIGSCETHRFAKL